MTKNEQVLMRVYNYIRSNPQCCQEEVVKQVDEILPGYGSVWVNRLILILWGTGAILTDSFPCLRGRILKINPTALERLKKVILPMMKNFDLKIYHSHNNE